jgi:hypothetical protein
MPALAQQVDAQLLQYPVGTRFVTATGKGTVTTTPDQAVIVLAVRTWSKDLRSCFSENETKVKQVLSVTSKYHIEKHSVQTSQVSVAPTYSPKSSNSYEPAGRPNGYRISKTITILSKDLTAIPSLLSDAIDAGANSILKVEFRLENPRKSRDDARILALRAAKEKATAMAQELHGNLGKALVIKELGSSLEDLMSSRYRQSNTNMFQVEPVVVSEADYENAGDIAAGAVEVSSTVSITFELTD